MDRGVWRAIVLWDHKELDTTQQLTLILLTYLLEPKKFPEGPDKVVIGAHYMPGSPHFSNTSHILGNGKRPLLLMS